MWIHICSSIDSIKYRKSAKRSEKMHHQMLQLFCFSFRVNANDFSEHQERHKNQTTSNEQAIAISAQKKLYSVWIMENAQTHFCDNVETKAVEISNRSFSKRYHVHTLTTSSMLWNKVVKTKYLNWINNLNESYYTRIYFDKHFRWTSLGRASTMFFLENLHKSLSISSCIHGGSITIELGRAACATVHLHVMNDGIGYCSCFIFDTFKKTH